jgi:aspartate/methionine/tyrosine aminotransferase
MLPRYSSALQTAVDPANHLSYGSGPKGSPRLRKALASFLNANFDPREAVRHEDILVLPGVTSFIDCLTWSFCNEGEGIIIPQPFYMGFSLDVPSRARGVVVPAVFQPLNGYNGFDDVFDPAMNVRALETALRGAEEKGIKVRAVLLTK